MTRADLDQHLKAGTITEREHDVLLLRLKGLSQWQIALALDVSRWAVRDRERNGLRKIELHHRKDAA